MPPQTYSGSNIKNLNKISRNLWEVFDELVDRADWDREWRREIQMSERTTSSIGRDSEGSGEKADIRWEGEIRMDSESGRARSRWIKRKEILGALRTRLAAWWRAVDRLSMKKSPRRLKLVPKRTKLMRKPRRAKIRPKRAKIGFCNIGGTWVMLKLTSVGAKGLARTRS